MTRRCAGIFDSPVERLQVINEHVRSVPNPNAPHAVLTVPRLPLLTCGDSDSRRNAPRETDLSFIRTGRRYDGSVSGACSKGSPGG